MSNDIVIGGSFQRLDRIIAKMSRPAPLLRAIEVSQAEEALMLVKRGFRNETDPYGKKWAPRARAGRVSRRTRKGYRNSFRDLATARGYAKPRRGTNSRKILSGKSNKLRAGWHRVNVPHRGWGIAAAVDYAIYHQRPRPRPGTGKLKRPRRAMVPNRLRGLPPVWRKALQETAVDAIKRYYRR